MTRLSHKIVDLLRRIVVLFLRIVGLVARSDKGPGYFVIIVVSISVVLIMMMATLIYFNPEPFEAWVIHMKDMLS